ncbi:MAG TPA: hypothetical protein VGN98_02930 [Tianweitania sediminis]|jgi:hypothetical protein|nr:hypothetical protein [Tianweitania sediminis]
MSDSSLHGDVQREASRERPSLLMRYFRRFDEGEVMRWAFRGLLIGAIAVLVLDLRELSESNGFLPSLSALPGHSAEPILPPMPDGAYPDNATRDPRSDVTTKEALLEQEMRFSLEGDGRLKAVGRIGQGSADRLAEELEERGEYVQTIVIDSPGGALEDAIAMGRLVREKGFATEVQDGSICASSCPLFFAGGTERTAGKKAALGLHQFYAMEGSSSNAAAALSSAQATTAKISRYLIDMGVDARLWLHALDTPPQRLYYLTPDQQAQYRLVTGSGSLAAAKTRPKG